jgi:hypothetical protein
VTFWLVVVLRVGAGAGAGAGGLSMGRVVCAVAGGGQVVGSGTWIWRRLGGAHSFSTDMNMANTQVSQVTASSWRNILGFIFCPGLSL